MEERIECGKTLLVAHLDDLFCERNRNSNMQGRIPYEMEVVPPEKLRTLLPPLTLLKLLTLPVWALEQKEGLDWTERGYTPIDCFD